MKPYGSMPATGPYNEPDESSPRPFSFNIILPCTPRSPCMSSDKSFVYSSSLQRVLHAQPIVPSYILSP
jgi:hypothetical protein